jgi:hypothetical protein
MLQRDLSPESWETGSLEPIQCRNTAVVYINTWQFEGYDDAKAAILTSVLLQLHEHKRFGAKVRTRALKLLKGINAMRLVRLSFKYGVLPAAAGRDRRYSGHSRRRDRSDGPEGVFRSGCAGRRAKV